VQWEQVSKLSFNDLILLDDQNTLSNQSVRGGMGGNMSRVSGRRDGKRQKLHWLKMSGNCLLLMPNL
jgi:hypothetical protein